MITVADGKRLTMCLLIVCAIHLIGIDVTAENPHKQINVENIETLTKSSRITTLAWGSDDTEILVGRIEPIVKVYNVISNTFTETHSVDSESVVGLARFDGKLIVGLANGKIQIGETKPSFLESGDAMSRLRQCNDERKLIATGGKERQNHLKVWDLETGECTFKTKNIPNDFLQLEVPIWDSDFRFVNTNCLSTCSRHGYIRVYDRRQKRRPIASYTNDKEQMSYTCLAAHENTIYVGATTGVMRAFDLRKMKQILHTYKGFSGSISDIDVDDTGKFVYSASLDRFVRVHASESTILQYQCYVKSKATRILLRTFAPKVEIKSEDESENESVASDVDGNEDDDDDDDDVIFHSSDQDDSSEKSEFDEIFDKMPTVEYVLLYIPYPTYVSILPISISSLQ